MSKINAQSFLFLCGHNGKIEQVIKPIQADFVLEKEEKIFDRVLPNGSDNWNRAMGNFNQSEESSYWQGFVADVYGEDYFCFIAILDKAQVIVLGMKEKVQHYLYEEILKINGQLTNTIRTLYKEKQVNEVEAYDEISKVNNELTNARRELQKKNLELEMLNHKLEEISIRDPLTGLFNRRYFYSKVPEIVSRSKRFEQTYCIILIDINGFKAVNDNYGHDMGDEVLKFLALCLTDTFRQGQDIVFRMGGDEFLVLMEGTAYEDAVFALERLREVYAANPKETSLAAGVLEIAPEASVSDFTEYLKKADELMYSDKARMKANLK